MATVPMYEYRDESGAVVRVGEQEYGQLRRKATVQLAAAITRVQGTAEVWRNTHAEHMNDYHAESWRDLWDKPQRIIGVASDIRAGVVPPPVSMWGHPLHAAEEARKALDAGDLVEAARLLRLSEENLKDAKHEWNTYIEASISGAGKLEGELETIRDTSFAIAVGAAVIVAAPVVAAGAGAAATGIGLTGTAATVAGTGGAALGTGLVGLGTGTALRGGSDIAAQKIATGKVDLHRSAAEVRKHAKEDFVAGVTAGLAPGAGKLFGAGSEGLSMTQNVLRQGAAAGTATGVAHLTATGADTAYALGAEGKTWEQAKKENLLPGLEQTGRATLAAGIGGGVSALPGTAAAKLAATGRPMLGQAVQHGGGALAAAATTLVTGGSSREAVDAALSTLAFSVAQPGAHMAAGDSAEANKAGQGGPAKTTPVVSESTADVTSPPPSPTVSHVEPATEQPSVQVPTEEAPSPQVSTANEEAAASKPSAVAMPAEPRAEVGTEQPSVPVPTEGVPNPQVSTASEEAAASKPSAASTARRRLKDFPAAERARVEELRVAAASEAMSIRTGGVRNPEGLPPGWDYDKYPYGPKGGWTPGDPVNMPDGAGNHPSWATIRRRVWRTKAANEQAARAAGVSSSQDRQIHLDPVGEMTANELGGVAKTGKMPPRVGAEIEHKRIPQRMGRLLEKAGFAASEARELTKLGDPSNLEPTHKEWHAVVDEEARKKNPNRNPTLASSLDDRGDFPLGSATNEEITAIVDRIVKRGIDLGASEEGKRLREILSIEKERRRASAKWTVP